jgi:hypothetical protein
MTPNGNTACIKCADRLGIWLQTNAPSTFTEDDFELMMQRAPLTIDCNECQTYPCAICVMGKEFMKSK